MACRDVNKAQEAKDRIRRRTSGGELVSGSLAIFIDYEQNRQEMTEFRDGENVHCKSKHKFSLKTNNCESAK
jgi:hypothetical protein